MLNIVCVRWGDKYGPEYVNRLYAMVARSLAKGTHGRFICYADSDAGLRPEISVRPLPLGITGWFNKLYLFAPGQFSHDDRVLYFDLDTLVIDDLDAIAKYDGEFAILRDFYRERGWQSSVMMWRGGFGAHIWQQWNKAERPEITGGDQVWIERVQPTADILQDKFPGAFVSFKRDCQPYPPEGAKVVVFHGHPRPHECGRKWVETVWHEGELGGTSLELVRNTHLDIVRKQIKASAKRDLPRLTSKPAHDGHVSIIGGGPSLADMLPELLWRWQQGQGIWALNGAYDWLIGKGITPDALVLLDARRDNTRFIENASQDSRYYIASQCHPAVYERLKGFDVTRIDLDVMGDCGTTVGTHAMSIAFVEGYRQIHLYGFDSSYREGEGHAYRQDLNSREAVIDVQVGERSFKSAPWMAQQAKDFEALARDMVAAGCEITVHGDGLLPYIAYLMAHPLPTAAEIRAKEVLKRLNGSKNLIGAEIGVFGGDMSAQLLKRDDLTLYMIDSWEGSGAAYQGDSGDWHSGLSQAEQDAYCARAIGSVHFAGDRAVIRRERSDAAAVTIPDGALDFAFIDADHSYEGCARDIGAWRNKVKPGGILCGHDYENTAFPKFGVKRAVDEFAAEIDATLDLGENFTWFLTL